MAKDKRANEYYDALDGWREATRKYCGDCEGDPTIDAIKAYLACEKMKEEIAKKSATPSEMGE